MGYGEGESVDVEMHDRSHMRLRKLHDGYSPTDKLGALRILGETALRKELLTGMIYINEEKPDFLTQLEMVDQPLAHLGQDKTLPSREALAEIMAKLT